MNEDYPSQSTRRLLSTFVALLFFHALNAYAIGPVPIQWLSQLGIIGLSFWLLSRSQLRISAGTLLTIVFLMWAVVVTAGRNLVEDYSALIATKATTGYWTYIGLRFMNLLVFLSTVICCTWLLRRGCTQRLVNRISWLGVVISLYAIFVYAAQINGWPEPPRTRVGTDGGAQAVTFTYAFHRAMGSFREPSFLAEWLMLPLFASFIVKKLAMTRLTIIASALLLTGSLTGIAGTMLGLAFGVVLSFKQTTANFSRMGKLLLPLATALIVFSAIVAAKSHEFHGLGQVLWSRVEPLFSDKGVMATNRNYVYLYVEKKPTPLIGEGLGNANIKFGRAQNLDATASFLSLYVNTLFSLGLIGLILLVGILSLPVFEHIAINHFRCDRDFTFKLAMYGAWIVAFFSNTEEFSVHFGIAYALVQDAIDRVRVEKMGSY